MSRSSWKALVPNKVSNYLKKFEFLEQKQSNIIPEWMSLLRAERSAKIKVTKESRTNRDWENCNESMKLLISLSCPSEVWIINKYQLSDESFVGWLECTHHSSANNCLHSHLKNFKVIFRKAYSPIFVD